MTSSAIFDGLETGLERYDWKPNTQRQKREKIYLHYNPRSKSNWKEKVQENKNQNIEPFMLLNHSPKFAVSFQAEYSSRPAREEKNQT